MATVAGTINNLSNGVFHVKDENGNDRILKVGDTIYENDTVYGDSGNSSSSKVEILLSGSDVIVLNEGQKQLIDSSLIETAFGKEELFFTRENLDLKADEHNSDANVVSDLRDAEFKAENNKDITEEDTAEGEEEVEDETTVTGEFQARDGNATDIISDLRNAQFKARTQVFQDKSFFENESKDRLTSLTNTDRPTYTNPPTISTTPSTPTPPPPPKPVTPPPSIIIGNLSVDDVTSYESDGFLIFTVSLDRSVASPVTFTYSTSPLTATSNGVDYNDVTGRVTIPAGSTSVTIKVPITDDYLSDNGETIKINISNVVGNANITKPEGIGTILDNPVNNPENGTPNTPTETGGYGEEDSVYAIITGAVSVNEGNTTTYTVKLVDKDGNPVIVTKETEVTIKYTNVTTQDGDTEFNNNNTIIVKIPANGSTNTFTVESIDDYLADNGEKYNVAITKVDTNEFENVVIGDKSGNNKDVTTTILDNPSTTDNPTVPTDPTNPNNPDDGINYGEEDSVYAIITGAVSVNEGNTTTYTVKLVDKDGNPVIVTKETEVTIKYTNVTTQDGDTEFNNNNTIIVKIPANGSTNTFTVESIDDYLADNGEKYNVAITKVDTNEFENVVIGDKSGNNKDVTTTILDNPSTTDNPTVPTDPTNPNNPDDGINYGEEDSVYAIITGAVSVNEGNTTTYTVKLVDKDGNPVIVTKETEVTIKYTNVTTQDGDTEFNNNNTIIVKIPVNGSTNTFTVESIDDYLADNGEKYNVAITKVDTNEFENVVIGDKSGNNKDVTTTILDNPSTTDNPTVPTDPTNPNNPDDGINYGEEDSVYAIITGAVSVNEGNTTTYTVKLVDKDGNPVIVTKETEVTIKYTNVTTQDGDTEFNNNNTIIVKIPANGSTNTFTVESIDDYLADNGEKYNVAITKVDTNEFENVVIGDKSGNNKDVTTTILDNPSTTDNPTVPTDPTNPNNPDDGINYGEEDSVYAIITGAVSVNEGNTTTYTVKLVDKDGNPVIVTKETEVTIKYTNVTTQDGDTEFNNNNTIIVKIPANGSTNTFTVESIDDYLADNGEKYNVAITKVDTNEFENVVIGDKSGNNKDVTTTILDNPSTTDNPTVPTDPTNPNNPDDGINYGEEDSVYAIITGAVSVNEGNTTTYTVKLVDKDGNPVIVTKETEVTIKYTNVTTQDGDTEFNNNNTIIVKIPANGSTNTFTVESIDDYLADNGEKYNVAITKVDTNEFENVVIGDKSGNNKDVTTTILDNPSTTDNPTVPTDPTNPNNPDDGINYGEEDSVYAIITGAVSVNEGNTTTYTVKLVDKDGNPVIVTKETEVTIKYTNVTTQDGDTEFNNNNTIIVKIPANGSTNTFTVESIDDYLADNGEKYNVAITKVDTNEFENVVIGDKSGNNKDVTTTILDNPSTTDNPTVPTDPTNPNNPDDGINYGEEDSVYAIITGAVSVNEGNTTTYTVKLVDKDGNPVIVTKETEVTIKYTNVTTQDGDTEFNNNNTIIVKIPANGSTNTFTVESIDDYLADNGEKYNVAITKVDTNEFENVVIGDKSGNNKDVTTTILDNPSTTDNPTVPTDPTNPNNPDDGINYGEEDSVYVKITKTPSTVEGGNLVHTITLVDKDGNPVTVPAEQTVTVNLTYTVNSGNFTESDLSTIVKQVTITGNNSSVNFTNVTKDDFTYEGNEVYDVTISSVTQSGAFENVAIHATQNSVTGTILDGVTLGTPDNAYVDEDNFDITASTNAITDTKSLNITTPNTDNGYTLSFDNSVIVKDPDTDAVIALTSNGQTITFDYSTEGKIIATRDGDNKKVFEIILNKNGVGGSDDNYTYTQYENLDHPDANVDDNIVLTFGYKITDGPVGNVQTSSVQTFTVTVNDCMPSGVSQNITLNEDNSKLIVISDESFLNGSITLNNGDGDVLVSTGNSINIYDNVTDKNVVGSLKNNGDGTLTFTPTTNYSGTTAGFTYSASDNDGDTASSNINITVNPIADKPDMNGANTGLNESTIKTPQVLEDNNNNASVEAGTPYTATIGLILPQSTDTVDLTTNTDNDQPEKLGLITLSAKEGTQIDINNDGIADYTFTSSGEVTIYINDVANYHYNGITAGNAVLSLSQSNFENMKVIFKNDNATNPKFTVSVDSYEVNDDDTLKSGVAKASNSQNYEVDILAVTDPITLAWDDITGTLGTNNGSTFTFTTVNEGYGTIDLKSLLTKTSGLENDADGDLDGSEHRSYTITGIPEGTIVTLGSNSVAADSTGTATINFPDNTNADPEFKITIAEQFSGTINGIITLNVTDTDSDSTGTISTQTASVDFTMIVNPVADPVTLKVSQAKGDEDAGRTNSNDEKVSADTIDAPQNGIVLNINVLSDDNKDIPGVSSTNLKEEYNVTIDGIPDGGSLYVYDNNSSQWVLVNNSTDLSGYEDLSLVDNPDGTWKITINDYQNDQLPKFIPPYNSDTDYTFSVSANSFDTPDTSLTQVLQLNVVVDAVADIPANDDLASANVSDDDSNSNNFTLVTTEDSSINLKDLFSTPASLNSNDSDGSETLTFKVTGLADGFSISGATFIGGTGTDRIWLVDKAALNAGTVSLVTPTNYAGEVDFQIQFVTTENAGDSKTHPAKDVSVMITPIAEGSIGSSDTQNEDESKVLNFGFTTSDTDGTSAGKESLVSFSIDMNTVPSHVKLIGSISGELTGSGNVSLNVTNGVLETVTAVLTEDIDTDYSFNISYTYNDVAVDSAGHTYTDTKSVTNQAYSVIVNAITDDISLAMATTTGANNTVDGSGHVTVTGNGTFTKTLTVTGIDSDGRGSSDTDGSEIFTRVTVSGVPEGITVVGGIYAGDTGGGNYSGYWYVDVPNDAINPTGTYDLVFDVDGSFAVGADYPITVTAYSEDAGNGVEQDDSQSFTLTIDQEITGPGPGTPATITAFYQDIDNDGTHDHSYVVSTTTDTTITDSDAYQGSVVREDTQFALSDVIHVGTDVGTATSQDFSITIKNVPAGVTIEGMTLNADGFYTLSGSGNQQAIVDKLKTILITPITNENTDANDINSTDLNFDIELTTYASGGASNNALINFTASVLPATDAMDLTVVNDGSTNEDQAQTFSITLDNSADGVNTQIIDGKVYLKLTENYSDAAGADGTSGTLSYGGNIITATAVSGVSGIADGNYYVIDNVSYNDTLNFTYTPASNRDGSISVDVYVKNIEKENWTTYDTSEMVSHKTITFDVKPVVDGFTLNSGAKITGTEDTLVPLDITLTSTDSSEKLSSVSISGLPDGFLLYYGENSDGSGKKLANNLGTSGTTTMQMTYGVDETVDVNNWNLPLVDGKLPTYIWIQAPENWSGTIPDLSVVAVDAQGNIFPETIASGTITPVVDDLTLNATQTFGKEGEDILLNLNANVQDLDGSETVTLTLKGFGDENANFKANGEAINSVYDSATDTYTIQGINVNDINALSFVHSSMSSTTITVGAKMVESDGSESSIVNDSFDIKISQSVASSEDDTLLLKDGISFDGLAGIDTLVVNEQTLDPSKVSNIEILDLNAGNNNISLSLQDVLDMTDNNNDLKILGDSQDNVSLTGAGWSKGAAVTENNTTFDVYTNSTDNTVQVKVEQEIQHI